MRVAAEPEVYGGAKLQGRPRRSGGPRKRRSKIASDVDQELFAHFNGWFEADVGLHSANLLGGSSSGHIPDGFNNAVKYGVVGPNAYILASRVARAVETLSGPPPRAPDVKAPKVVRERHKRTVAEWNYYLPALRGYYTRRAPGALEGLVKPFGEFAGVVACVPAGIEAVTKWCAQRCQDELAANLVALDESRVEVAKRNEDELKELEEKILRVELVKEDGWVKVVAKLKVRAQRVRDKIASAGKWQLDTQGAIKKKWSPTNGANVMAALRAIVRRADVGKDTPDRQDARQAQYMMRAQAEYYWRAAREAYVMAKRENDRDVRKVRRDRAKAKEHKFAPKLPVIPADQD